MSLQLVMKLSPRLPHQVELVYLARVARAVWRNDGGYLVPLAWVTQRYRRGRLGGIGAGYSTPAKLARVSTVTKF